MAGKIKEILESGCAPGIICRWGTGRVSGERVGYDLYNRNPKREITADLKALEEKAIHTDNLKKRADLKEACDMFAEANEDVLRP
jgi:hypothetical protein